MAYTYGTGANANYSGRPLVYPDQVPFDTDILREAQYRMVDVANLAQTILGLPPTVGGSFSGTASGICTQQSSPNMTVEIGVCSIYALAQMEPQAYGSIPVLTTPLLYKQFINMIAFSSGTLGTITAPSSGDWQYYLIQGTPTNSQINSVTRPYYNASDPSSPGFTAADDTEIDNIVFSLVAGTASSKTAGLPAVPATTGSGVGMFLILVSDTTTSITNSLISGYPHSYIKTTLPQIPYSVQNNQFGFGLDTSVTPNTVTANLNPSPLSYVQGMRVSILMANTNIIGGATLNLNGLGAKTITYTDGGALSGSEMAQGGIYEFEYDGTNFQLLNPQVNHDFTQQQTINSSGNFTVPAGIYKIKAQGKGAGGGGAGGGSGVGGGGGASGSYAETTLNVIPGQIIACVIATGGTAGTAGNNAGDGSGTTSFGTFLTAPSGKGGFASGIPGTYNGAGTGLYVETGFVGQPGIPAVCGGSGGGTGAGIGTNAAGGAVTANSGGGGAGGFGANPGSAGSDGFINIIY